jgi:hypothetical protein
MKAKAMSWWPFRKNGPGDDPIPMPIAERDDRLATILCHERERGLAVMMAFPGVAATTDASRIEQRMVAEIAASG